MMDKLTQAFRLSNLWRLIGQICASLLIIIVGKLEVRHIHLGNHFELGYLTIPFTCFILIGFTNVMTIKKAQNYSILLLPFVTFACFSISAFVMGNSFVFITGICANLTIMCFLLYGYFSGKVFVGRTLTTSIGFVIALLSISLIKASIITIYIPIFTLGLPFTLYYFIKDQLTSVQSIIVSTLTAILFSVLLFMVPFNILWYFVVALTIILVFMQFSRKYRFI